REPSDVRQRWIRTAGCRSISVPDSGHFPSPPPCPLVLTTRHRSPTRGSPVPKSALDSPPTRRRASLSFRPHRTRSRCSRRPTSSQSPPTRSDANVRSRHTERRRPPPQRHSAQRTRRGRPSPPRSRVIRCDPRAARAAPPRIRRPVRVRGSGRDVAQRHLAQGARRPHSCPPRRARVPPHRTPPRRRTAIDAAYCPTYICPSHSDAAPPAARRSTPRAQVPHSSGAAPTPPRAIAASTISPTRAARPSRSRGGHGQRPSPPPRPPARNTGIALSPYRHPVLAYLPIVRTTAAAHVLRPPARSACRPPHSPLVSPAAPAGRRNSAGLSPAPRGHAHRL
ncbi:hypothetical protein B0H15DRAFT_1023597, partial [Mycena belliarum]